MNKSLSALIVFFALVILLTIIIINTRPRREVIFLPDNGKLPKMKLSPFAKTSLENKARNSHSIQDNHISNKFLDKLFITATYNYLNGRTDKAEDNLKTFLTLKPDSYKAVCLLGHIFFNSKRYKEAEMLFRKYTNREKDREVIYNNLGMALASQGKFDEGAVCIERALKINPEYTAALLNLTALQAATGQNDEALKNFIIVHEQLGPKILPIAYDRSLDNIRNMKEFKKIISMEERKLSANKSENKAESSENKKK